MRCKSHYTVIYIAPVDKDPYPQAFIQKILPNLQPGIAGGNWTIVIMHNFESMPKGFQANPVNSTSISCGGEDASEDPQEVQVC